jgi:hypothetical protein
LSGVVDEDAAGMIMKENRREQQGYALVQQMQKGKNQSGFRKESIAFWRRT